MKLIEAVDINNNAANRKTAHARKFVLACGFEPLHLRTFLTAYLHLACPGERVDVAVGLFGDLAGNIERLRPADLGGAAVVVEWSDLDPRLGLRQLAGWTPETLSDILPTVIMNLSRIQDGLRRLSEACPVALCLPSLPLPPLGSTNGFQTGAFEMELVSRAMEFGKCAASNTRIRVVSSEKLEVRSSLSARRDPAAELFHGFPYSQTHADAVAGILAELLRDRSPKKGLITDLDGVFWRGILGEVGVAGVSWDLGGRAGIHGIYQRVLKALAARGVLLAVASKNDPALVEQAFARDDLQCPGDRIYPFCVHWRLKSESVSEILRIWNVGADSVVFVDDSPMELAEVKSVHPEIECLLFPHDAANLLPALEKVRDWFGRNVVRPEDLIRSQSIRSAVVWRDAGSAPPAAYEELLSRAEAHIVFDIRKSAEPGRPLELINKTNQFNLNGIRYSEAGWNAYLSRSGTFVATVSYTDKFGPLGIVAAALGERRPDCVRLDCWVMSCRAFSRRIEHRIIDLLFSQFDAGEIAFNYLETARNGPLREFLAAFDILENGFRLTRERFSSACPALVHSVEVNRL